MVVEFFNLGQAQVSQLEAIYYLARKYMADKVLIVCKDAGQAKDLDEKLWNFEATAFLPHGLAEEDGASEEPVLLNSTFANINQAQVLILAYNPPQGWLPPKNFKRVVEMIPSDQGLALDACRHRYRVLGSQVKLEHTTSMAQGEQQDN